MFNVGGGELLVILLVALIVLGPDKLPDAARKMGNIMSELKRMSQGFQNEIRQAMEEPPPEPPKPPAEAAPAPAAPMMLDAVATEKAEDVYSEATPAAQEAAEPPAAAEGPSEGESESDNSAA